MKIRLRQCFSPPAGQNSQAAGRPTKDSRMANLERLYSLFQLVFQFCWVRHVHRATPMPLAKIVRLHRFAQKYVKQIDPLRPRGTAPISDGKTLRNPKLAALLKGTQLGDWSLAAESIDYIEEKIKEYHPRAILEFGSGISTLCMAFIMKELQASSPHPLVFSIEQSQTHLEKTRTALSNYGLIDYVRFLHVPIVPQRIVGFETTCYNLYNANLSSLLGDIEPEFVLIDGPAGEKGCRFGTLPLVKPFLSDGAVFFMDDALRDGEISIANRWSKCAWLNILGIVWVGKGFLVGTVQKLSYPCYPAYSE